jgi:hypothetical protein
VENGGIKKKENGNVGRKQEGKRVNQERNKK